MRSFPSETANNATAILQPTGVAVDANGRSVTLTFARPFSGANLVLLDYTDPGQGASGAIWDAPHNRALSFARFVVSPEDDDGTDSAVEANAPGLPDAAGVVTPGDGNGDGVPDAIQPDVTSFGFVPGGAAGPASYATLVAGSGGGGAQLGGVSQTASVSGAPTGLVAPYGEFRFNATVGTPGGIQSFRLLLPDDPAVTGYWKVSRLDGRWHDIATSIDRSVPGTMGIAFSIQDGGAFDDDGVADGTVFDPGVPGSMVVPGTPATPTVRAPTTNGAAPTLSGTWGGANGGTDTLSVTVAGVTYTAASGLAVSGTDWPLRPPALGDGAYDVTASATRIGGGSVQATAAGALTVDTVAPSVTAWLTRDSNAFRTVGILRTEALTGVTDPGAALGFTEDGRSLGTAWANAGGAWVFRPGELGDGSRGVVAEATDAAGNVGRATLGFTPVVAPTGEGGVGVADWRAMDLAGLLNEGGSLRFVAGTERVILADGTLTVGDGANEAFLTRLYHGLFGRAPEAEGIAWWQHQAERGASKTEIAEGFLRSDEYAARPASRTDAQFVRELYQRVLGREGAAEEIALWAGQLDAGRTRGAVLADIADSAEAEQHWSDVVTQGVWVRDMDAAVVRAAYLAAFGREAEVGGLRYWTTALESGAMPGAVGAGLGETAEFRALYAEADDAGFVESLYENGLGRTGEAQGVAGWVDALRTGAMTRGDVLMGFAQSAEGQRHLCWAL